MRETPDVYYLSPVSDKIVRFLGWVAFAGVLLFVFSAKGGSRTELLVCGASGVASLLGACAYMLVGRAWARGKSREEARSVFRGYIMGSATTAGYGLFVGYLMWTTS